MNDITERARAGGAAAPAGGVAAGAAGGAGAAAGGVVADADARERPGRTAGAAAELFTAISVIRRTARRAARQAWTQEPLPPAQSELLRLTAARPGITVADAAQELRLAPNTVSTLVGRLTDAGLLSRERGAQDARTAVLAVTDKARRRLAEFRDLRAELAGQALARLTQQDQQALAAAAPALLRLAGQMERT